MALQLSSKRWTPSDAARVTGVSPDLQRQWRKQGLISPLPKGGRAVFNYVHLVMLYTVRMMIDAGVPTVNLNGNSAVVGTRIITSLALYPEAIEGMEPVTNDEAHQYVLKSRFFGDPSLGSRYLAIRGEKSDRRNSNEIAHPRSLEGLSEWMRCGEEPYDPQMEEFDLDGNSIPPEYLPTEEDRAELRILHPPLSPTAVATIIDTKVAAELFLAAVGGPVLEVWDVTRDVRPQSAGARAQLVRIAAYKAAAEESGRKIEKILSTLAPEEADIIRANIDAGEDDIFKGLSNG